MARRILNNAQTIISYDKNDDTARINYVNARDAIVLYSDETFIEFDTPNGKNSISIKNIIKLLEKENKELRKDSTKAKLRVLD